MCGPLERVLRSDSLTRRAAEDSLNISLKDITVTGRDGRVSQLDQVYIRGSMIRFFIVPDMLQNAPMSVPPLHFGRLNTDI